MTFTHQLHLSSFVPYKFRLWLLPWLPVHDTCLPLASILFCPLLLPQLCLLPWLPFHDIYSPIASFLFCPLLLPQLCLFPWLPFHDIYSPIASFLTNRIFLFCPFLLPHLSFPDFPSMTLDYQLPSSSAAMFFSPFLFPHLGLLQWNITLPIIKTSNDPYLSTSFLLCLISHDIPTSMPCCLGLSRLLWPRQFTPPPCRTFKRAKNKQIARQL